MKTRSVLAVVIFKFFCCLGVSFGAAAETGRSDQIEEVTVVSSFRLTHDGIYNPDGLEAAALRTATEMTPDLMRIIRILPSVNGHEDTAQVNVRGGRENELPLVLDGFVLRDPYHLINISNYLNNIDPFILDSVRVTLGNYEANMGNSTSGVLQLETRTPVGNTYSAGVDFTSVVARAEQVGKNSVHVTSLRRSFLDVALSILDVDGDIFSPDYYDFFHKFFCWS